MVRNYASLAFTAQVKALQEQNGSRQAYARMERQLLTDKLTDRETDFIQDRDSFYMASIGENGFPYVQHRGGPKGFLGFLDVQTLGFADLRGNKQYITAGNTMTNPHVSLFLMDYASQTRLKIYAKAELVDLKDSSGIAAQLTPDGYQNMVERFFLLHVQAYDWNCPKYIVPRYTAEEVEVLLTPLREHVESLEAEISRLKVNQKSS